MDSKIASLERYLPSQKTLLDLIWHVTIVSLLGLISVVFAASLYWAIWWTLIPKVAHEYELNMNFAHDLTSGVVFAQAFIDLQSQSSTSMNSVVSLARSQNYDVNLELTLPLTRHNLENIGNFVSTVRLVHVHKEIREKQAKPHLKLSDELITWNPRNEDDLQRILLGNETTTLYKGSRMTMIKHESDYIRTLRTVTSLPLILLDISRYAESQTLKIPILNGVIDNPQFPITHAHISLCLPGSSHQQRGIDLYSAVLRLDAQFTGIRYWMYYYSVPCSFIFVFVVSTSLMILLCGMYAMLYSRLSSPSSQAREEENERDVSSTGSESSSRHKVRLSGRFEFPSPPPDSRLGEDHRMFDSDYEDSAMEQVEQTIPDTGTEQTLLRNRRPLREEEES